MGVRQELYSFGLVVQLEAPIEVDAKTVSRVGKWSSIPCRKIYDRKSQFWFRLTALDLLSKVHKGSNFTIACDQCYYTSKFTREVVYCSVVNLIFDFYIS
jgi:hypothetical protein